MNSTHTITVNAFTQYLHQLTIIRSLLLVVLWSAFVVSIWLSDMPLPYHHLAWVLCSLSAIHLLTFFRLKNILVITSIEFFIQLLLDVLCLNLLFYFSGGATNPFISYLLVPICISAATLPWRFTWFITALCILAYSLLLFFHAPLPIFLMNHENMNAAFNWHIWGMWFNFFMSAILITYFIVKMANSLRSQDDALNQLREDELRNEQLLAVATLAAGAAHEMNTPLATMTILLSELKNEYQHNEKLCVDFKMLSQQVSHCANSLKQMVEESSFETQALFKSQDIKAYCNSVIDRWQLMRPGVPFTIDFLGALSQQPLQHDSRLAHAIINLLNNAADASPGNVTIHISTFNAELSFKIIDEGEGIHHELANFLGKKRFTTKVSGLGIGMLLSHATIKRYGGNVLQMQNYPKGTITEIKLPLASH